VPTTTLPTHPSTPTPTQGTTLPSTPTPTQGTLLPDDQTRTTSTTVTTISTTTSSTFSTILTTMKPVPTTPTTSTPTLPSTPTPTQGTLPPDDQTQTTLLTTTSGQGQYDIVDCSPINNILHITFHVFFWTGTIVYFSGPLPNNSVVHCSLRDYRRRSDYESGFLVDGGNTYYVVYNHQRG
jgi:hypothetical protein